MVGNSEPFYRVLGPVRKGIASIAEAVDPDDEGNGELSNAERNLTGYQFHREVKRFDVASN